MHAKRLPIMQWYPELNARFGPGNHLINYLPVSRYGSVKAALFYLIYYYYFSPSINSLLT